MFRSFAVTNYRWWFAGALVSNVGTWMQRIAQDWLVLTQLTTNDATAVGVTMALQFGPQLLLLPITGLVADRYDRRKVLLVTQICMALLALGLGVITLLGVVQLWMVFGFALGLGVAAAFDAPARQAFVSQLVPRTYLANAVGLNSASFNGARLIGPAIAGLLVAMVGAGWVFIINAVTFGAVIGALLALRSSEFEPYTRPPRAKHQIREGWQYTRKRGDIVLIFVMVFLVGTFGFNFPIYTSTMARVEFGIGADGFGILSSVLAIGSVAGALLAAKREHPRLRTIAIASGAFGLSLVVAALAPTVWAYGAVLVVVGFCSLTMMTTANAYVQTTTAPAMRGRVMALYLAIFVGGTPIGAPLVGWVADTFGPRWAIGVGALSGLVAAAIAVIWYARSRQVRVHWTRDGWWPLSLSFGADGADAREQATREIAIVEAETQRS